MPEEEKQKVKEVCDKLDGVKRRYRVIMQEVIEDGDIWASSYEEALAEARETYKPSFRDQWWVEDVYLADEDDEDERSS